MKDSNKLVEQYYVGHRQELLAYVAKGVAHSPLSEDIVQNVFLRLLQSDKMITAITLPALVYTIAKNMVSDYWRHKAHVNNYNNVVRTLAEYGYYDIEKEYSARELTEKLEQGVVRLLNANQQMVYRMNTIDGMKVAEISTVLGKPYKTVEFQLGAARKQMREYMSRIV